MSKMTWLDLASAINKMPARFLSEPATIQAGQQAFFIRGMGAVSETWFDGGAGDLVTYAELKANTDPENFTLADYPPVYFKDEPFMEALTKDDL